MRTNLIHEEQYRGLVIRVFYDTDPPDPRTAWDNYGTMHCWDPGGRRNLGDPQPHWEMEDHRKQIAYADFQNTGMHGMDFDAIPEDQVDMYYDMGGAIMLPLYIYDHGGVTMSTTPFSCKWDSRQCGYIHMYFSEAEKNFAWAPAEQQEFNFGPDFPPTSRRRKRDHSELWDYAVEALKYEVQIYDSWLQGECYGFEIYGADENGDTDDDSDHIASSWGFLGDDLDFVKRTARMEADSYVGSDPFVVVAEVPEGPYSMRKATIKTVRKIR